MGRKKLSMAEKIRRYVTAHPDAKPRDIASKLEVPVNTVYVVRHAMKKNDITPTEATTAETIPVDMPPITTYDVVHQFNEHYRQAEEAEKHAAVNHPSHYVDGGIDTIDFIEAKLTKEEFIGYLKGNAIKYASRIGKKDEADVDAGKMAWYAVKLRDTLSAD